MDNSHISKKHAKMNNREATIKHYILGFILECIVRNDAEVLVGIRRFLVHDLKILSVDMFVECLRKARMNRLFGIRGTRKNYKNFKKMIQLVEYDEDKQIEILKRLQEYAKSFENGLYINAKMGESNFVGIKSDFDLKGYLKWYLFFSLKKVYKNN